jgi:hypothetical protein
MYQRLPQNNFQPDKQYIQPKNLPQIYLLHTFHNHLARNQLM